MFVTHFHLPLHFLFTCFSLLSLIQRLRVYVYLLVLVNDSGSFHGAAPAIILFLFLKIVFIYF